MLKGVDEKIPLGMIGEREGRRLKEGHAAECAGRSGWRGVSCSLLRYTQRRKVRPIQKHGRGPTRPALFAGDVVQLLLLVVLRSGIIPNINVRYGRCYMLTRYPLGVNNRTVS